MSEYVEREFEAYRKDDLEARSILDLAATEARDLTPEESERFDRLFESAEAHRKRADKMIEADRVAAEVSARVRQRVGEPDPATGVPTGDGDTARLDARLGAMIAETRAYMGTHPGQTHELALEFDIDEAEVRAIANFSDAAALYTADFSTKVAVYARTLAPWVGLADVINATNGRPLVIPKLTADPTGYTPGEGTAITENSGTLGSGTATPAGYKALSYISNETEEDELIGLMGIIAKAQGRQLGLDFGSALTAVVLAGASNGGTASGVGGDGTATVAFFGYEDLLDLKYGRAAPYRLPGVGVWAMSNGAIKKVRKFKDVNRQYYWQPAIAAGQPPTFDDHPVYEDPALAAPASATKSVVFGDPASLVVKQMPLRVAVSTEYRFNTDQVALRTVYRAGGVVADPAGLAYLVSANT